MSKPNREFAGKLVVITGAASGIGEATALAFAEQGASLELADIDAAALNRVAVEALRRGAQRADARLVDVSDSVAVLSFAWLVQGRADTVDVLVNNAGVGLAGGFWTRARRIGPGCWASTCGAPSM